MSCIYVAGPMRGIPEFNFPEFFKVTDRLINEGHRVFSPADADVVAGFDWRGLSGNEDLDDLGFDLAEAMARNCDMICHADRIHLLPGWEASVGCRVELALARMLYLDVTFEEESPFQIREQKEGERYFCTHQECSEYGPHVTTVLTVGEWRGQAFCPEHLAEVGLGSHDEFHDDVVSIVDPWDVVFEPTDYDLVSTTTATEVRSVSSTGGEKGTKPEVFDQFPTEALMEIARVYGFGAAKYEAHNFRRGYEWSKSYNAMMRHLIAWQGGEDNDPESGLSHLAHAAWHCMTLLSFRDEHPDFDDRYVP